MAKVNVWYSSRISRQKVRKNDFGMKVESIVEYKVDISVMRFSVHHIMSVLA